MIHVEQVCVFDTKELEVQIAQIKEERKWKLVSVCHVETKPVCFHNKPRTAYYFWTVWDDGLPDT